MPATDLSEVIPLTGFVHSLAQYLCLKFPENQPLHLPLLPDSLGWPTLHSAADALQAARACSDYRMSIAIVCEQLLQPTRPQPWYRIQS